LRPGLPVILVEGGRFWTGPFRAVGTGVSNRTRGRPRVELESNRPESAILTHRQVIERAAVPRLVQVGWLDASTVDGALGRFRQLVVPTGAPDRATGPRRRPERHRRPCIERPDRPRHPRADRRCARLPRAPPWRLGCWRSRATRLDHPIPACGPRSMVRDDGVAAGHRGPCGPSTCWADPSRPCCNHDPKTTVGPTGRWMGNLGGAAVDYDGLSTFDADVELDVLVADSRRPGSSGHLCSTGRSRGIRRTPHSTPT
jgi:hypothetical protein